MSQEYNIIKEDLQQLLPLQLSVPSPNYCSDASNIQKVKSLYRQLLKNARLHNRKGMLLNAFYTGEILEVQVETPKERSLCMKELTSYYQKAIVKTYFIFEKYGIEQIFRTKEMTLAMVFRLKQSQVQEFIEDPPTIVEDAESMYTALFNFNDVYFDVDGTPSLEGEVVNLENDA
jgi:hypothetical protein